MSGDNMTDNLIADDLSKPKNKIHSILTIIALFIIVLMSAIIVTKIMLNDSDSNSDLIQDPDTLRDPDLTLDESHKNSIVDDSMSIKPPTQTIYDMDSYKSQDIDSLIEDATPLIPTPIIEKEPMGKEVKEEIEEPKEKKTPKKIEKPVEVKKIKEVEKPKVHNGSSYYIQVGSFSEKPSTRFTKVITANGFKYIIRNSSSGNKKLLIGPFDSRSSANKSLSKIRDKINKQAYIVK